MKKSLPLTISLILLLQIGSLLAGAFINYFHASSDGDNVILSWQTSQEINVKDYVIERKTLNGNFIELAIILPRGDNSSYSYVDESAYKTSDAIYIYRLKIVDNDLNISYSSEVTVSHSVSSVKRTWGSIKALFR